MFNMRCQAHLDLDGPARLCTHLFSVEICPDSKKGGEKEEATFTEEGQGMRPEVSVMDSLVDLC